ncbi:MAG: carboxypeptidase-like regulatory domain-containing protein, partial [Planctomycetota bacterium]
MKAQLNLLGLGLAVLAMPLFNSTTSAQFSRSQYNSVLVRNSATQNQTPTSAHTYSLDSNGNFSGRVANLNPGSNNVTGLAGLNVVLVQNNQIVRQVATNSQGEFLVTNLPQGAYSLIAAGQNGFAAQGIQVNASGIGPSFISLSAAPANSESIRQLVENNLPLSIRQAFGTSDVAVNLGSGVAQNIQQFQLNNGQLNGRISTVGNPQTLTGTQVYLLQDGQTIAQVQTDGNGQFSIPDLGNGVYDIIALNQGGFAATRFNAVSSSNYRQIAFQQQATQPPQEIDLPLAPQVIEETIVRGQNQEQFGTYLEPSFQAPTEFAGESVVLGGATGGAPVTNGG